MQSFRERFNRQEQCSSSTIPYSARFIKFIEESREQQTLCANLAGNEMPEFEVNDKKELEEFLSVSLYDSQLSQGGKNYEERKKILDKIFESFHNGNTVQLTVIWIFCYSPDEEQTKYLPVFLIRNEHTLKYMDTITFKYFYTWKDLVGNVQVKNSFLCFPRGGMYQSKENVLDLEFMWSGRRVRNIETKKEFVPFCISFVKNWCTNKIKAFKKAVSETWTKVVKFYKAHYSEINFSIHIILIIVTVCINPTSQLCTLISYLRPKLQFSVQTNDGPNGTSVMDPRSTEESLQKFECICINVVAFSQLCMDLLKKGTFKSNFMMVLEKLHCISRDVMAFMNDKIVSSLLEKITRITVKQNDNYLENVRNVVPIGNDLSISRYLSECNSNKEYEKYIIQLYNGSDFKEVQKTALHMCQRNLKLIKKSNMLLDHDNDNLIGYVYFLPNVIVCVYLKSAIPYNKSGNYTFTIIED